MSKKKNVPLPIYKPILGRVPAQDLQKHVGIGLEGARYHFDKLCAAIKSDGMATPWRPEDISVEKRLELQSEINQFHWHLRAFFWELVAEIDMLLVLINETHALGIPENLIDWKSVAAKALEKGKWSPALDKLKNFYLSNSFSEIRTYRNFAHRSPLFVQCDVSTDTRTVNAITVAPSIEGQAQNFDLMAQLAGYLAKLQELLSSEIEPAQPAESSN